jgi:hypothetical protein
MNRPKALIALGLASVTFLSSCGGGTTPQSTVKDAEAKTLAAKTASLNASLTIGTATSTATGPIDLVTNQGHLSAKLNGVIAIPDGTTAELVLRLPIVYAKPDPAAIKSLNLPTPWITVDLRQLSSLPGLDLGTISAAQSLTPRNFLLQLRGANTAAKGTTQKIGGVSTTHYAVVDDLRLAVKGLQGADATALNTAIASYTTPVVNADVWIDGSGLIRRATFRWTTKSTNSNPPTPSSVTFNLTSFGTPVDATPPPSNQTTDIITLIQRITGTGK